MKKILLALVAMSLAAPALGMGSAPRKQASVGISTTERQIATSIYRTKVAQIDRVADRLRAQHARSELSHQRDAGSLAGHAIHGRSADIRYRPHRNQHGGRAGLRTHRGLLTV